MITDPISNFLTRLRNASCSRRKNFTIHSSNMIKAIAKILAEKGFLENLEENTSGKIPELTVHLNAGRGQIHLTKISKPGQRIYKNTNEIKRIKNGFGIGIYSTSKGVITDEECRKQKVGGEYICEVY